MCFGLFVPDDSAADRSVEEILKEAEDLVRETSNSFSGLSDSSDLLKLPITSGLVRSMAVGVKPESTTSTKMVNKHFITKGKGKEAQKSVNRVSTLSTTYRKVDSKLESSEVRYRGEQLRGMSPRRGMEEFSGDMFSGSSQLTYSNTHDNIGARTDDVKVGSVISGSESEKHTGNYSGSISKEKSLLKKERTVTFGDSVHLFPKPTGSINKKQKNIVPTSSQKLQQVESIPNGQSDEISNKDDDMFALESAAVQRSTRDGLSATEDRRVDQLTKVMSVSPPLIQHGDVVGTPEAIFELIDSEVRNEVVATLQEPERSCSQDSDQSSLNIEKEMEKIFGHGDNAGNTMDSVGASFPRKPRSVVQEESNVPEPSLGVDKSKDAITMTEGSNRFVEAGDSSVAAHVASLEKELHQERSTVLQLKSKCVKVL
jgi:hypothetical protein